ncbi:MAG: sodium/solute symporter [Verrucomicrobiota bacterium]
MWSFLALLFLLLAEVASAQTNQESFSFAKRELSLPVQRAGMFVGQSGGALIVGGGLDENGAPSADVFVQTESGWKKSELKAPVAFAGFVCGSFPEKIGSFSKFFIAGGVGKSGLTDKVFSLEWRAGRLQQNELPPLPQAVALAGVGFFEDQAQKQLYVVGGTTSPTADSASQKLFRYAFSAATNSVWEELPPLPGEGRLLPGVICFYNDVQIFGGFTLAHADGKTVYTPMTKAQAYRWHCIDGTTFSGWRELSPLPEAVGGPVVFQTGQVHAGLAGGYTQPFTGNLFQLKASGESKAIQVYHNVTDTWVKKGELPEALAAATAIHNGKLTLLGATEAGVTAAYEVTVKRTVKSLRWPDYAGLFIYFATVAFAGIYFTRKTTGSEGFALGDRKIPWWMAGISMFASAASSISFMAIPALAFRTSLLWALPVLVLIPLFFLEAYVLYPLIRKLEITSTFEYLERRFHPSLRFIASAQAIALQTFGRMNMVLLLPALAIAAVTGLNVYASVLVMGVVTTIYSAKGGMKAVVLTEVVQGLTMVVGISLILILAITGLPHGWQSFVEVDTRFNKFNLGIWSFDYTMPIIWILVLTPLFNKLAFAADAPTVQRVFATPLKDVRKLALIFLCFSVFISFAVNFAGISVFAYFHAHPGELDPAMTNDQVIPLYIVQRLPVGVAGLIIASLFAASMSALAGSMNTVSILFTEDFYRKFKKNATDGERLWTMRIASVVCGVAATITALYMAKLNQRSLFQTWNELFALLGGGFLGIYILGTYTHRANAIGAFTGAICSIGVCVWLKYFTSVHWYFYSPGAVISCVVVGYVVSLLTPPTKHSLVGLTVFDMKAKNASVVQNTPAGSPAACNAK